MKIGLVILAAGYSRRMGVLKPLLPVGGESALHRVLRLGKTEKVHLSTVVTGYRREEVEAELDRYHAKNIRHIYNGCFDEGMFSSVKAGVHSLPGDLDGFFLLPADHCAVKPETLEKLIAAFILENRETIVYPTYCGTCGHPPLIPFGFVSGLKSYSGGNGMQGYLSQFPSVQVEVDDGGILLDMDTPSDYAALLSFLGLPVYPDIPACEALLVKYGTPEHVVAHCHQVNILALGLCGLLSQKGIVINEPLLSSACLLHDIVRQKPAHDRAGAELLLREGYPETALLVGSHMELPDDYVPEPDATALLYLADKLSHDGRTVRPAERLSEIRSRHAENADALSGAERRMAHAQAILEMLERRFGITFEALSGLGSRLW